MLLEAELELDGAVDPLAAAPDGDVDSEPLALLEPPDAGALFDVSVEEDAELEAAGSLGVVLVEAEELSRFDASTLMDVEPEGAGVVEPDADEDELAGALGAGVVLPAVDDEEEPAGGVVRVTVRSVSLSQPASPAPSARETATARIESLMCWPPWLGYD